MFSIWQAIDADGNKIETWRGPKKSALVGTTMNGSVVASIEPYEEPVPASVTRSNVFAATLDKMNPVWYNTLTDDQKTRLASWRQEWLDYPSTNTEPTTDVSDIF